MMDYPNRQVGKSILSDSTIEGLREIEKDVKEFPHEVHEILDLASVPDGIYSAKWVSGGIQLVETKTKVVERSFYWSGANHIQDRMRKWLAGEKIV
jgi:hypothetical protein